MVFREIVKKELDCVEIKIRKGKGVYGESDYVRDNLHGQAYALRQILRRVDDYGF